MELTAQDFALLKSPAQEFYLREVTSVAADLLGKLLIRRIGDEIVVGKIVEVEAYDFGYDEASHSFKGVTKRNREMFAQGGRLYVYFIYGVHFCANVVTGDAGKGAAVLLRALEPVWGEHVIRKSILADKKSDKKESTKLLNGPGKICKALQINMLQNGVSLDDTSLRIVYPPQEEKFETVTTTRIGITKSKDLPYRFYIKGSKYISCK